MKTVMKTTLQVNSKTVIFTDNHHDALRIDSKKECVESFQWLGYIAVPDYMPQTQYIICSWQQYQVFSSEFGYAVQGMIRNV